MVRAESTSPRLEHGSRGKADPSQACNYCQRFWHWKNECPVLRAKGKVSAPAKPKPTALAAPVPHSSSSIIPSQVQIHGKSLTDSDYSPFVTDGFLSLGGTDQKVPVKILRNTGASESYVLESVLPFSTVTDTSNCVLVQGIGLNVLSVPLHRLELTSYLVQGEVKVGVHTSLPVDGVDVILGNNLAGGHAWRDVSPPLVVSSIPSSVQSPDENAVSHRCFLHALLHAL